MGCDVIQVYRANAESTVTEQESGDVDNADDVTRRRDHRFDFLHRVTPT